MQGLLIPSLYATAFSATSCWDYSASLHNTESSDLNYTSSTATGSQLAPLTPSLFWTEKDVPPIWTLNGDRQANNPTSSESDEESSPLTPDVNAVS